MFSKKVACGSFVKRQTKDSGYSHFNGSWEDLEKLVTASMEHPETVTAGYRDGVILVEMAAHHFSSAIVDLTVKSKLIANFSPRREGEAPFIRVAVKATKQPAKFAFIVLYRHDVLAENNERQTDAEWEIVAIKARVSLEEDPMDPYTMARNFLHLEGGTKGDFTAEQFAKSIVYWNSHSMCRGHQSILSRFISWIRNLL